jgi:hypothetical protein
MTDKIQKKPNKLPDEYVLFYRYLQERLMRDGVEAYNEYMRNGHKQALEELSTALFWEASLKLDCDEFLL